MLIENDTEGESPDMTVTLTTCTTFINTGPPVGNPHSVLKHLSLPLGITGWHNLLLKATATFPSKSVASTGQATTTADHLILRPGETRLDKHQKQTGRQLTAAKPGCRWWRHGPKTVITQWIRDSLITVHGILDPWPTELLFPSYCGVWLLLMAQRLCYYY